MGFLDRLRRLIVGSSAAAGCLLLILNIADILIGVIARQVGETSIVWTEEAARFALVWCALIGAATAFAEGDHMFIDFIVNALPRPLRALCRLLSTLVQAAVLCVLVWYGAQNVMGGWTMRTMALRLPRAIPLMAVPIGMGMLLAVLLIDALSPRRADPKGPEKQPEGR